VVCGALVVVDVSDFELVVVVFVDWATGAPFPVAVVVGSAVVVVEVPVT
jgi:hypothetical protein